MFSSISQAQQWQILGSQSTDATPKPIGIIADSVLHISMAVSPQEVPYIAFVNTANDNKVSVMRYNAAGGWEAVGAAGISAGAAAATSIAIAAEGTPYLYYRDMTAANLSKGVVMKFNGTAWETVGNQATLQAEGATIDWPVIATNPEGIPFIAHRQTSHDTKPVNYRKFDAATGDWVSIGLFNWQNSNTPPEQHTIFFSNDGRLHWAGKDFSRSSVRIYSGEGEVWTRPGGTGNITTGANGATGTSHDNIPYLLYRESQAINRDNLTLWRFTGTGPLANGWELVGPANFSGNNVANANVAVTNDGTPLVAYETGGRSRAIMKSFNSTTNDWQNVAAPWGDTLSQGVADYTEMTKGPQGNIYVAFSDVALHGKPVVLQYKLGTTTSAAKELDKKADVQVYPNPSASSFRFTAAGKFSYTVYNNSGQVMERGQGMGESEFGTALRAGLYFVQLQTEVGNRTLKLLKQ
ncbi:T9SS type A sorting domain-containing protein [Pontibacter qinzhouensis]|nr:T9SS type A sorting domain-containing protein [Pontibacter qinzhouensis]